MSPASSAVVPPIPSHGLLVLLLQLSLLLALATAAGRAAVRVGLPAVVGELVAGVVLGPSVFGAVLTGPAHWLLPADPAQFHLLDTVGQLGLVLLVGLTGAELDTRLMHRTRFTALRVSVGGLVLPLALGVLLGLALPRDLIGEHADRPVFALFMGVALAVTAIPVIARILLDTGLLHGRIGQLTLAAAMVDDVVGWLLLSVVSALASTGLHVGGVLRSIGLTLAVAALAVFPGRRVVDAMLGAAGRSREPAATLPVVVVLILAAAAGTQAAGLEAIYGAFVCGLVVGSSPRLDRPATQPLWSFVTMVLAPLFFVTAGLRMDLSGLARPDVLVAGLAVLATAVFAKVAGAYLGARASRIGHWDALTLGFGMNVRGVVGIVIAAAGVRLGVLNTDSYTTVVLVAIVTSLMAPPLMRITAARAARARIDPLTPDTDVSQTDISDITITSLSAERTEPPARSAQARTST